MTDEIRNTDTAGWVRENQAWASQPPSSSATAWRTSGFWEHVDGAWRPVKGSKPEPDMKGLWKQLEAEGCLIHRMTRMSYSDHILVTLHRDSYQSCDICSWDGWPVRYDWHDNPAHQAVRDVLTHMASLTTAARKELRAALDRVEAPLAGRAAQDHALGRAVQWIKPGITGR